MTSLWRRFRGKRTYFAKATKPMVASTKHVGNKLSTQKAFVKTLSLQWWSKKLKFLLVWGPRGQKLRISVVFWSSSHFSASQHPPPHQTCRKDVFGCLTTSHQISSRNIDRKILFLNKIKKSTRWPSYFLGLFLAITPKLLRLAAFPRSLKLRK